MRGSDLRSGGHCHTGRVDMLPAPLLLVRMPVPVAVVPGPPIVATS